MEWWESRLALPAPQRSRSVGCASSCFLIVVPVVSFATFSNRGILKRLTLEGEKSAMQAKVQAASLEQRRLRDLSKSLENDPRAIEKVAREKYGMVRDGETVYKVKKEK